MTDTQFFVYVDVSTLDDKIVDEIRDHFAGVVMSMRSEEFDFFNPRNIITDDTLGEVKRALFYCCQSQETAQYYLEQLNLALGDNSNLKTGINKQTPAPAV